MSDSIIYKQLYQKQESDFYARQLSLNNLNSVWFKKRQGKIFDLVDKYSNKGLILDIGCGNSAWHRGKHTVLGLDICYPMLRDNLDHLSSYSSLQADFDCGLPLKDNSVETVVISELFEHFVDYSLLIKEIGRVLKKQGRVIVSVPYCDFPGVWGWLFPLWCRYKWFKEKSEYYQNKCGHQDNFSVKKLVKSFQGYDLLTKYNLWFLTIFFVFEKKW